MSDRGELSVLESEEILSRGIFHWRKVKLTYRRFDGSVSEPVERIVFDRGDSVGMLLHDLSGNEVILVEQLRIAAGGRLLELPAGTVEKGDEPEATAHREIQEETGAQPAAVQLICTFYLSPGA